MKRPSLANRLLALALVAFSVWSFVDPRVRQLYVARGGELVLYAATAMRLVVAFVLFFGRGRALVLGLRTGVVAGYVSAFALPASLKLLALPLGFAVFAGTWAISREGGADVAARRGGSGKVQAAVIGCWLLAALTSLGAAGNLVIAWWRSADFDALYAHLPGAAAAIMAVPPERFVLSGAIGAILAAGLIWPVMRRAVLVLKIVLLGVAAILAVALGHAPVAAVCLIVAMIYGIILHALPAAERANDPATVQIPSFGLAAMLLAAAFWCAAAPGEAASWSAAGFPQTFAYGLAFLLTMAALLLCVPAARPLGVGLAIALCLALGAVEAWKGAFVHGAAILVLLALSAAVFVAVHRQELRAA